MIIENISLLNVDKLFNICADIYEDEDYAARRFEKNVVELYNQISIRLDVSSLSFMEYYHIKNILQDDSVTPFVKKDGDNMAFITNTYPEVAHDIRQVRRLAGGPLKELLIPAGCTEGSCKVTVYGRDLSIFMEYDPMRVFFATLYPEEGQLQNSDRTFNREFMLPKFKDGIITDEELEGKLINVFMSNFYSSMVMNHQYVDLLSDYAVDTLFYNPEPVTFLDMNKAITASNLSTELPKLKGTFTNPLDEVRLTFSIGSNFLNFLTMYAALPKRCFSAIQSLRFPHSEIHNFDMFRESLSEDTFEALNMLKEHICENYEVSGKEIVLSTMVFNYAPMNFILSLSLAEITHYFSKLDSDVFGFTTIHDTIIKYASLVYKSVV